MTGVVVNARRQRVPQPDVSAVRAFHEQLPAYRRTPLHELTWLPGSVWLKDEGNRLGLPAFKVLGASWAVEQLLRHRAEPVHTLVAASAGNHGRAVARVARDRGLDAYVLLPAATSPGRVAAIVGEGARVVVAGDYAGAVAAAERMAREPGHVLVADVSDDPADPVPRWIAEGYSTIFAEAGEQAPEPFDVVLCQVGVGAFATAAVRWAAATGAHAVAVEPAGAACAAAALRAGSVVELPAATSELGPLNCASVSAVAWPTLAAGLTGAVAVGDGEVFAARAELASHGVAVGDCGAAGLAGLHALATAPAAAALREAVGWGQGTRMLLVATEGPAADPRG